MCVYILYYLGEVLQGLSIGMSLPIIYVVHKVQKEKPPGIPLAPRYPAAIPNLAAVKWRLEKR